MVQNKMHWAAHGHTAAEIVADSCRFKQTEYGPYFLDRRSTD